MQCTYNKCKIEAYEGGARCILHCKKDISITTLDDYMKEFYDQLFTYIIDQLASSRNSTVRYQQIYEFLKGENKTKLYSDAIRKKTITLNGIHFPPADERNPYDYFEYLSKLQKFHFNYCKFYGNSIPLEKGEVFFQDCDFKSSWRLYPFKTIEGVDATYQSCRFNDHAGFHPEESKRESYTHALFKDCSFQKRLSFYEADFDEPIFNNSNIPQNLNDIELNGCNIKSRFELNECEIDIFRVIDCVFHGKFEFKENKVRLYEARNSNYLKIYDIFGSVIKDFRVNKNIHEGFAGFEQCEFGSVNESGSPTTFKYVTFLDFTNFRDSKFNWGLDIKNTNLKEQPNFLGSYIDVKYTNRESFRIIKNSFDKAGNIIEANKIFVLEMRKYKEELSASRISQEKVVVYLNSWISNFGSSYMMPFMWLVLLTIVYVQILDINIGQYFLKNFPRFYCSYIKIKAALDNFVSHMIPFKKFLYDGSEVFSLLFYIVFASFLWHIIVAIKRHTKR